MKDHKSRLRMLELGNYMLIKDWTFKNKQSSRLAKIKSFDYLNDIVVLEEGDSWQLKIFLANWELSETTGKNLKSNLLEMNGKLVKARSHDNLER